MTHGPIDTTVGNLQPGDVVSLSYDIPSHSHVTPSMVLWIRRPNGEAVDDMRPMVLMTLRPIDFVGREYRMKQPYELYSSGHAKLLVRGVGP